MGKWWATKKVPTRQTRASVVCTVHSVQTGFVRGRSMLANILRLEGAIEEYGFDAPDEGGGHLPSSTSPRRFHRWRTSGRGG